MKNEIFESMKTALNLAPRNKYTSELHLQMIKYADELNDITAKEFCECMGLAKSFWYGIQQNAELNSTAEGCGS